MFHHYQGFLSPLGTYMTRPPELELFAPFYVKLGNTPVAYPEGGSGESREPPHRPLPIY